MSKRHKEPGDNEECSKMKGIDFKAILERKMKEDINYKVESISKPILDQLA